jgi:catechol 2,3-dioxygenase-like lactoylglutathione lyase family enzyme
MRTRPGDSVPLPIAQRGDDVRLHHVQVACARGTEESARRFYRDGLGLVEVEKPADLRARGGAWFRAYDESGRVTAEVHVGVEDPFVPARKAHPALQCASVAELEDVAERLIALGFDVDWSQRHTFPGNERCHTADGQGNRVELLAPV